MNGLKTQLSRLFLLGILILSCGSNDPAPEDPPVVVGENAVETVGSLAANDALSVDASGNVYASNFGQFTSSGGSGVHVIKVTTDGVASEFVRGLSGPMGNLLTPEGDMFIVNNNSGTSGDLLKVSDDGTKEVVATINGWPSGIARDADGNLYIANFSEPTIHKYSTTGELSVYAQNSRLAGCVGIDVDENGVVYAASYLNGDIVKVDNSGNTSLLTSIANVQTDFAIGYMAYYDGQLYATDIGRHYIHRISTNDGTAEVFAGSGQATSTDGTTLLNSSFNSPNGIAIDKANKIIYVLDWGSSVLRKISL